MLGEGGIRKYSLTAFVPQGTAGSAAWGRLEVDPSSGGALDWDAGVADAVAELPGSAAGQEPGSDAAPPAAAPALPAGVHALAPTIDKLDPLVNPNPDTPRSGNGPVASASVRDPGPAVLGRRRKLLGLRPCAGLGPASADRGPVAGKQLQDGAGQAPGDARRFLQGLGERSGSGGEENAPGSAQGARPPQATPGATLGAARLLVRRAPAPDPADPEVLGTLSAPPAQRAPLLQRLLQRWRSLGSGSGRGSDLAAAPEEAAGPSSAQGSADAGFASRKHVIAAQRVMEPPPWVTLATTSLAVAPGGNATLQLMLSGALEPGPAHAQLNHMMLPRSLQGASTLGN